MDISMKNLILAGIGTLSYTYERGSVIIDQLVKKGDLTVTQGKELRDELMRKIKPAAAGTEAGQNPTLENIREALASMNLATRQDIDQINQRLERLENKQATGQ